jgi:hypothetical protein
MPPQKSKTNLSKKQFESRAKFKHTRQGNGKRSLARGTRKLRIGQGK